MAKEHVPLFLDVECELQSLADNIRTARRRRKLSLKALAGAAKTSLSTLVRIEAGDPSVAIGTVLEVLSALRLLQGFSDLTKPENDVAQVLEEVRNLRLKRGRPRGRKFSPKELNF